MCQYSCKNCLYYRQHYTFDKDKIFRVYYGHCTHQNPKSKRPDSRSCIHYVQATIAEDTFVTKEYLSKALLDYVLKLELFPEICEKED